MAVEIERRDKIAIVTMSRPEALNAFNTAQIRDVIAAFQELRADRFVRCIILTGAGDRAFAAGADIKEMAEKSLGEGRAFARLGQALTNTIEGVPQPTIAAVNGFALGGGSEVAISCDIRLASENAVFAQPEVNLGIPPGWGATQRLPRLVGPGLASELIFTGRRVKADEALRIGLVNAVYPRDELLGEAEKLAKAIAANSPRALRESKQLIRLAFNGQVTSGLETEARLFGNAFGTPDQREGMRAFLEKRIPEFTGE
jgi:enoyl-CoA hydratase